MSDFGLLSTLSPVLTAIDKQAQDPNALDAAIRQNYGYEAWALEIPELKAIVEQGVRENWDAARIQGALQGTDWWKQHTAAQRQWAEFVANSPAEADPNNPNGKVGQVRAQLVQQAAQKGVDVGADRLSQLALDAATNGWNQAMIDQALAAEYQYDPNRARGTAPGLQQLKALSKQYLVPMADDTLNIWTQQIMAGQRTPQQFQAYLVSQAKSLFPTMTAAIDQGVTPNQYLDPYRQTAAQLLEIAPDSIDFLDPRWSKAVNTVQPDGSRAPMDLWAWQNELRTNGAYGYDKTAQARSSAADLQKQLEDHFGITGTVGSGI